MIYSTSTYKAD